MLVGIAGRAGSGKDAAADALVAHLGFVKVGLADPLKRIAREAFDFSEEQLWGPSEMLNKADERYPREHTWVKIPVGWKPQPTRELCCRVCGFEFVPIGRQITGEYVEPMCFLTPRHALQQLGTEWGRACFSDIWIDYALRVVDALSNGRRYDQRFGVGIALGIAPRSGVVIPDVRFPSELTKIKAAGGMLVLVERPSASAAAAAASVLERLAFDTDWRYFKAKPFERSWFDYVIQNDKSVEELRAAVCAVVQQGLSANRAPW
jgi:hypothetical protein